MAQTLEAASDSLVVEDPPPRRARVLSALPVGVCAAAAATIALIAKAVLFPLFSGNSDESVYIYQARMLTQGHVTLPARVHADFFHPWLFGQRGGRLFPQYQPAWPTVIAIGHFLGSEKLALVIAAAGVAVAIWFLAQEFAPGSAIYAVGLFLISPIFIVHSATYLPYIWMTALVIGGTAAALAGVRTRQRWPYALSGVLFGLAQLTRPFDALIFAIPTAAYIALKLWNEPQALRNAATWIGIGLVPLLLFTAAYNTHITGAPLRFPLQAASPLDTFGFGPRKLVRDAEPFVYTRAKAVRGLQDNAGVIPRWFAGGGIGLVLALVTVGLRRRRGDTWLLFTFVLAFPAVYFFWWGTSLSGNGARNGLGPHYYVPAFAPLAVLAGWSVQTLARRSWRLALLVGLATVVGTMLVLTGIHDNASYTTGVARSKRDGIMSTKLTHAIVVLRAEPRVYILKDSNFLVGDPRLNDDVLYAADRGALDAGLPNQFPTRRVYQWVQRADPDQPLAKRRDFIEPLVIKRGRTVTLRFDITNTTNRPVTIGYVSIDGNVIAEQTLDTQSQRGRIHHLDVVLGATGAPLPTRPTPGVLVVPVPRDSMIQIGAAFGSNGDLDEATLYERRYFAGPEQGHPDRITVQTPGLQYRLYRDPFEDWVNEDVGPHLVER